MTLDENCSNRDYAINPHDIHEPSDIQSRREYIARIGRAYDWPDGESNATIDSMLMYMQDYASGDLSLENAVYCFDAVLQTVYHRGQESVSNHA